jgi:hypothetical protein
LQKIHKARKSKNLKGIIKFTIQYFFVTGKVAFLSLLPSTSCEEICSLTGVTTPITNSGNGNAFQVRIPNSNISYEFNLNSSQNFYIIVSNQRGDEQFVATN